MKAGNVSETCDVNLVPRKKQGLWGLIGGCDYFLEATAIGPNGRYDAGSVKLDWIDDYLYHANTGAIIRDNAQVKLNDLIKRLYQEGWQSVGCGDKWYNARFRRMLSKPI
jgi:hypothetical protein